ETLLRWAREVFGRELTGSVYASTSICFDLSVFEIFGPLSSGGRVVIGENALEIVREREEVNLINTVPSAVGEIMRQGGLPESVRVVNLAGEALSRKLVEEVYEQRGVEEVWNLYGPSEDTTYTTGLKVRSGEEGAPTIGRPIWNTRVYVVDWRGE